MKKYSVIIIILLLLSFIPSTSAQDPITCTVTLKFEQFYNEHHVGPNNTLEGELYGNISCEIDAENYEYRYVKVRVTADFTEDWGPITAREYIFSDSGVQRFVLPYHIHDDCRNRTVNKITVKGTWQVEKYGTSKLETSGEAIPDNCHLIVYRPEVPRIMISSTIGDTPADTRGLMDTLGGPCVIAVIFVPAVFFLALVVAITMIYKKIKAKRKKIC